MNWELLGVNLFAIAVVTVWVTFASVIMFFFIDITIGLRVPPQDELVGLDHKYGGVAYTNEDIHHSYGFGGESGTEHSLTRSAYKTARSVKTSNTTSQRSNGSSSRK